MKNTAIKDNKTLNTYSLCLAIAISILAVYPHFFIENKGTHEDTRKSKENTSSIRNTRRKSVEIG